MSTEEKWNGKALRLRRASKDWTLAELKKKLGSKRVHVDEATVQRWERGRTPSDHRRVARVLSKLFGCSALAFYRDPIVTFRSDDDDGDKPW